MPKYNVYKNGKLISTEDTRTLEEEKKLCIETLNIEAAEYFKLTDWVVIRGIEGKVMPPEIRKERDKARKIVDEIQSNIKNCETLDQLDFLEKSLLNRIND